LDSIFKTPHIVQEAKMNEYTVTYISYCHGKQTDTVWGRNIRAAMKEFWSMGWGYKLIRIKRYKFKMPRNL
jgi:hypothetical protein